MKRSVVAIIGLGLLGASDYAVAVSSMPKQPNNTGATPKPVPVAAVKAAARDVPIILRGLGTVTAFNSVALRSRVEGAINKVNFREGQIVHAGDLLIQLDPRPYQAALDQAKANLARDQATLANAKTDLVRYSDLLKRNFAPEKQVTTQQTTVAQGEAAAQSDAAAVQAAQLNVDYAAVRSTSAISCRRTASRISSRSPRSSRSTWSSRCRKSTSAQSARRWPKARCRSRPSGPTTNA